MNAGSRLRHGIRPCIVLVTDGHRGVAWLYLLYHMIEGVASALGLLMRNGPLAAAHGDPILLIGARRCVLASIGSAIGLLYLLRLCYEPVHMVFDRAPHDSSAQPIAHISVFVAFA